MAVPSLLIWTFAVLARNPLVKFHVLSVTAQPRELATFAGVVIILLFEFDPVLFIDAPV